MKTTVLIVEDEEDLLLLYSAIIKKERFTVLTAADGTHGAELALRHRPDVILLDILLPGCDGVSLLRELRGKGITSKVVILTASPILHVQECVTLGISAYLNKAISTPREVVDLIRQITKKNM